MARLKHLMRLVQAACVTAGSFPSRGTPHPYLPISPWARYGESDDGVSEQPLLHKLCQEMTANPLHHLPVFHSTNS